MKYRKIKLMDRGLDLKMYKISINIEKFKIVKMSSDKREGGKD